MPIKSSRNQDRFDERTRLLGIDSTATQVAYAGQAKRVSSIHDATKVSLLEDPVKDLSGVSGGLHRGLSARQVQMIAVGESLATP